VVAAVGDHIMFEFHITSSVVQGIFDNPGVPITLEGNSTGFYSGRITVIDAPAGHMVSILQVLDVNLIRI
jgi:hypothetical protein